MKNNMVIKNLDFKKETIQSESKFFPHTFAHW